MQGKTNDCMFALSLGMGVA